MKAIHLLFSCCLISLDLLAAGKELSGVYTPADTVCPSPEEARKKMSVPEGYEVRCFAHEPMVQNPVAMTWDHRGRLWVVEAYEYPQGTPLPIDQRPFGGEAQDDRYRPIPPQCLAHASEISNSKSQIPRDRIIILEDTDNDGAADKRTVFLQGLNLASAILCGDGGIYVGQQPHLIHFRDDDGDDKPDAWRVCLTGFGREDTHELLNSFCWGPDGWLYMTHGVFTNSKVRRPGQPESEGFKFDAGIGRARPMSRDTPVAPLKPGDKSVAAPWEFEVFADGTSNPWGCDYDAAGNFFVSACVIDHLFHMAPGGIYIRQGGAPENPYAYELLPSIVKHKHFRAAYAGVQIYQGGRYPQDTWGHCFIGNIHDNAIHEEVLTPVGATFKAEPHRDFLRANDGWFRPVSTQTGPDGFLWIMDWCDKYPCYQNAKANPEGVDRERGRIWRVVWTGERTARQASAGAWEGEKAGEPPASGHRQSLVRDGQNFVDQRKGFVRDGKGFFVSGKTQSVTEKVLSATEKVWSVTDKTKSGPDKTQSVMEKVLSAAEKVLSVAEKTLSMTEKVWSGPEKDSFFIKTGISEAYQDHSRPETDMDLAKRSTPELVKLLEHPNNWMRRMARRMLVERGRLTQAELDTLNQEWLAAAESNHGIEALWTLHHLDRIPELLRAAEHKSPAVRQWFARIIAGNTEITAFTLMPQVARDPDIKVRTDTAISLRQALQPKLTVDKPLMHKPAPEIWRVLQTLIVAGAGSEDREYGFHVWMALEPLMVADTHSTIQSFAEVAPKSQPLSRVLTHKSMRRLCDTRKAENLDFAVEFCGKIAAHDVLLAHALDGLVKGQEGGVIKPTVDVSKPLAAWRASGNADVRKHAQMLAVLWGDAAATQELLATISNEKAPMQERMQALQTVRKVKSDAVRTGLLKVVRKVAQPAGLNGGHALASAATFEVELIRAAAEMGGDETGEALLKVAQPAAPREGQDVASAAASLPHLRLAALEALASRKEWTVKLLEAITAKKIPAEGFSISVRRSLAQHPDKMIRDQAFRVLGAWKESSDDIKSLITAKKKVCLEGEPDLANGKILFTATCGVCHTFHGGGQKVGPDLIGSGRSNLDALLANVIDPNQIIGNGYEAINVTAKDGRIISGRMIEDTPSHVKLLAIGGAESIVPRDQIAKLENTKQSLMPMGFGGLSDQQFRDLIWYVLAPPEEGPLTREKRNALSQSIDTSTAAKPRSKWHEADWESVSLWNPQWKVSAPTFERTPVKLAEYHGKTNVLLVHPFEDKKTPASFERKMKIEPGKTKLRFSVAADDRGDWRLKAAVNAQVVRETTVNHEKPRWKDVEIDLSQWVGQEVTIRLESHATDWSWEFAYWHGIELR